MAKKNEITVEEKLRALYDLQLIDSHIDEIRSMRGELPLEVEDLADEVAGLHTRLEKQTADLEAIVKSISDREHTKAEAKILIDRYTKQQENVRNNREYNSISKEIEYQGLEIELADKHIREFKAQIEQKKEITKEAKEQLKAREEHLKHKQKELDSILALTQKKEDALLKEREKFENQIEERLVKAYKRIRSSVRNGLAVVPIERGASGGSFFTIPPQVQMEIATRKKIMTDEHSGRILVDLALAKEETEKMEKLFEKIKG